MRIDFVVQTHRALGRRHITADCFQQRRFAAAGRPKNYETIGLVNLEVDPVGRRDQVFLRLILKGDAFYFEKGLGCSHRFRSG